jgi:hypothetical protein
MSSLPTRTLVAAFAITLLPATAFAQGTAEERSACMGDAFRFCSADIPSVSKIEACLRKNERQISPACRAEFHPQTQRTKLQSSHFPK